MKAIKNRIHSVENTRQITKAMELVASSKLRRAKEGAEKAQPFYDILRQAIGSVIASADVTDSPYLKPSGGQKTCYIVIAGDRGLAGGYNNNLFRLVRDKIDPERDVVLPIGKKAAEQYARAHAELLTEDYDVIAAIGVADALDIGRLICRRFLDGEFDRCVVAYTDFLTMMRQEPRLVELLPLNKEDFAGDRRSSSLTLYDPDEKTVLESTVPQYVSGIIHAAVRESFASECAARRTAMKNASDNASEMLDSLTLHYNRARQAAITQEITEIISGSEAL